MEQYGKLTNNQLDVVTFIDHGNSRTIGINAETAQQFGLKEIVDVKPNFYNYEVSYTETDTQIIVNYVEVVVPLEPWHEQTNFQIKITPLQNAYMNSLAPYMAQLTSTFIMHDDCMFIYFYTDEISEEDKITINFFGGEINDKD